MNAHAGGMLIAYQLGYTETTKAKELDSQTNKECKCTLVCGMLITGQREAV